MKKSGLIIGLVALAIVAMSLIGTYNRLVNLDNEVESQWAQIDNQLKRRADLIPNLVATVKGFAAQEQEIMTAIADSRARLAGAGSPAEAAEADAELTSALGRLLVVVENYPDLKSDQTFMSLMDELSGTENRISVARKDYNDAVKVYNLAVRTFPTNLIAPMFGFEKAEFFEITDAEAETPEVDFNDD